MEYYNTLPIEIWREICLTQWDTYKIAIRLNKTLNELLKHEDIKALFAVYYDSGADMLTCKQQDTVVQGWKIPSESLWLVKYSQMIPFEMHIWKQMMFVKKIKYSMITEYPNKTIYCNIAESTRYHHVSDNCMLAEHVEYYYGKLKKIVRSRYINGLEVMRDEYITSTGMITHYGSPDRIPPEGFTSRHTRHGAVWRIVHPSFFIFKS
ncbi:hypothetical protein D5a_00495 [Faustovirus]|nr:hypothetical protein D5a_00495 [Faustovirus]